MAVSLVPPPAGRADSLDLPLVDAFKPAPRVELALVVPAIPVVVVEVGEAVPLLGGPALVFVLAAALRRGAMMPLVDVFKPAPRVELALVVPAIPVVVIKVGEAVPLLGGPTSVFVLAAAFRRC